tara:strand:+ start:37342 stop:38205 length:864 start_codon:yes stop_codon:yes gene_type:complete
MNNIVYKNFDAASLDAAYDNRRHVPECEEIFLDWENRSRDYRKHSNNRLDVAYGNNKLETMDIFLPDSPSGGIHAFIHGGYWRSLDKADFSYLCKPLVDEGHITASVNYDLCPAVSVETIVEQMRAAIAWLYRNATELGGDPAKIHISGHSAGGHLAAMLLATDWPSYAEDLPDTLVKSVTAISGVFDLDPIPHLPTNEDIQLDPNMARRLSPHFLEPANDAPLTVIVGSSELPEFIRQSKDFADKWSTHLSSIEYLELCGLNHFTIVDTMDRANDPITARMLAYMK